MMDEKIPILLSKEEAIIIFDLLSRFSREESLEIADQSEKVVLWGLLCDLEKVLIEPFEKNYPEILEAARKSVRNFGE